MKSVLTLIVLLAVATAASAQVAATAPSLGQRHVVVQVAPGQVTVAPQHYGPYGRVSVQPVYPFPNVRAPYVYSNRPARSVSVEERYGFWPFRRVRIYRRY